MRHKQVARLSAIALSTAWLASNASGQDGLGDARSIMPVVMLVIDTSGSMERMPVTEKVPACSSANPGEKNRWTGALEALTGSFPSYACQSQNRSLYNPAEYDYGYYLPHIAPTSGVLDDQSSDGVLDSLQASVKFGMMTFDGQPTYQGGETLIAWDTAKTLTAIGDAPLGPPEGPVSAAGAVATGGKSGMYSYGPLRKLSFPGCTSVYGVNLGARGPGTVSDPVPGGLVSVGASDDPNRVSAINSQVQNALLSVRPYGGTPIAAVLDDLKYWLNNSPDLSYTPATDTTPAVGDPFYKCRDKYALLLTDGAPDALFRDSRYKCNSTDYPGAYTDKVGTAMCAPNQSGTPECKCPYPTERNTARSMVAFHDTHVNFDHKKEHNKLDRLFVVAFDITDPAALDTLDIVALAGNPDPVLSPLGANPTHLDLSTFSEDARADRVTTTEQLRNKLISRIFSGGREKATSRTTPITVDGNAGLFVEAGASSFEVRAGFKASSRPDAPWDGVLERSEIACEVTKVEHSRDVSAGLDDKDKFHVALNAQSAIADGRKIYTVKTNALTAAEVRGTVLGSHIDVLDNTTPPSASLSNIDHLGNYVADGSGVSGVNLTPPEGFVLEDLPPDGGSLNLGLFGDASGNGTPYESADRERVASYLNGVAFSGHALADIYHSNPVALGPLVTSGVTPRLGAWRRAVLKDYGTGGRPQVVFVGTNDGLLHAFNLDDWQKDAVTRGPGYEFWSFFPPALFSKVHSSASPTPAHQFMFDGDIIVKDMFVNGGASQLLATRTILLAAVRGAPAYVALDVTNPDEPAGPGFLWQFSARTLGNTIAKPALAQISVKWNGSVQERAVAILPGGEGTPLGVGDCDPASGAGSLRPAIAKAIAPTDARTQGHCYTSKGRALFVVDVATGTVLQEFSANHFPAPITGGVGTDETRPLTQSAYFTDDDGVLWHLGLDSTDPKDWRVTPVWDVFHGKLWKDGRPASYAPIVTRDRGGNDVVLLGTGNLDSLNDLAAHRVLSLTVRRTLSTTASASTVSVQSSIAVPPEVEGRANEANWEITLASGESVTGSLALLDGAVYFTTFASAASAGPSASACDLGTSAVWGADYLYRALGSTQPQGRLDTDETETGVNLKLKKVDDGNRIILGLSVGKDPLCLVGRNQTNPVTGSSGFVATGGPTSTSFQMRANVGSMTSGTDINSGSSIQGYRREQRTARRSRVVGYAGAVE